MYKLVIVDDEGIIREGLRTTVDWESLGFAVAGEAENGVKGLELIREAAPQVVLADIRMPVMDGLELLKAIKREMPEVKVVLLSGHEEFEFAREGLKLGAEGYILKLRIDRELPEIFARLCEKLDQEEKERSYVDELVAERRELLSDSFLRRALHGEVTGEDIRTLLDRAAEIPLLDGSFCVTCIQLDIRDTGSGEEGISMKNKCVNAFLSSVDFDIGSCNQVTMLQAGYKFAVVYFTQNGDLDLLYHRVVTKWKNAHADFVKREDSWEVKVTIGIGAPGKGWEAIYPSYFQARKAALFKMAGEPLQVLEWQQIKDSSAGQIMSTREQNELLQSIVMGDSKLVQQQFNYVLKSLEDRVFPLSLQDVRQFFLELLVLVKWRIRELDMEIPEELVKGMELCSPLYETVELADLGERMRMVITGLTGKCYDMRKQPSGQSVLKVARYIESHYSEKILLEEMANHVYMSASHFSVLFKQHVGKSFTDFLLDIRMKKARQLLEGSCPVNEAAERVGYQDIRHFSKTFKKYYGVNPSEVAADAIQ